MPKKHRLEFSTVRQWKTRQNCGKLFAAVAESGKKADVNRKLLTLSTDGRWKTWFLHKVHFLRFAYLTEKEWEKTNVFMARSRQKHQITSKTTTESVRLLFCKEIRDAPKGMRQISVVKIIYKIW